MIEQTLIIVKHDGVLRGLVGEIVKRFENIGLKIVGMKMVWADDVRAKSHYMVTDDWANTMYTRGKESADKRGEKFSFATPLEMATTIQKRNMDCLREGPVIAIVFEGAHAVELGRKLVGNTEPRSALPGTIRGDFMHDSYAMSDKKSRAVRNIVHASGAVEEAKREISLWFDSKEIHSYKRDLDKHHYL